MSICRGITRSLPLLGALLVTHGCKGNDEKMENSQGQDSEQATAILKQVQTNYESCVSYSDDVTGRPNAVGDQFVIEINLLRTKGIRVMLKYSLFGKAENAVVWGSGSSYSLYMSDPGGAETRPLGNALTTLDPLGEFLVSIVPRLLMPEGFKSGSYFTEIHDARIDGVSDVRGRSCNIVSFLSKRSTARTKFFVDQADFSIRRIETEKATLDLHPKFGAPVTDNDVSFKPARGG